MYKKYCLYFKDKISKFPDYDFSNWIIFFCLQSLRTARFLTCYANDLLSNLMTNNPRRMFDIRLVLCGILFSPPRHPRLCLVCSLAVEGLFALAD